MAAQVIGFLPPMLEIWIELPVPGFGSGPALAVLENLSVNWQMGDISLCLSVSSLQMEDLLCIPLSLLAS